MGIDLQTDTSSRGSSQTSSHLDDQGAEAQPFKLRHGEHWAGEVGKLVVWAAGGIGVAHDPIQERRYSGVVAPVLVDAQVSEVGGVR